MILHDEAAMIEYGSHLAATLKPPVVLELIGDVGAGKTTLVKGIAKYFSIDEPVTSPSFVLNKKYHGMDNIIISHYDFYRLLDPGIMSEELNESVSDPHTITIVEWAETVAHVLPEDRKTIRIKYLDDDSREVTL